MWRSCHAIPPIEWCPELSVTQFTHLKLITTFVCLLANRLFHTVIRFLISLLIETYFAFSSLQIRIWFQNRRARDKREKRSEEMSQKSGETHEETTESCGEMAADGVLHNTTTSELSVVWRAKEGSTGSLINRRFLMFSSIGNFQWKVYS